MENRKGGGRRLVADLLSISVEDLSEKEFIDTYKKITEIFKGETLNPLDQKILQIRYGDVNLRSYRKISSILLSEGGIKRSPQTIRRRILLSFQKMRKSLKDNA